MNETIRSMAGSRTVESVSVPMSTRMIFEWTFGYHVMFALLRDTLQNLGCIGILLSHHYAYYTKILVTGFVLLSCYCVPHPRDEVTCDWLDYDCCLHTERTLRISLHRRRSKSHSWAIWPLVKLSNEPVSCCYDHRVTSDVLATPNSTIG